MSHGARERTKWRRGSLGRRPVARACGVLLLAGALCPTIALAGPDTIAVVQGETLSGGGSNRIASRSADRGKVLKVSSGWPASTRFSVDERGYKLLVRGAGDVCDGAPVLELLIDGEIVLSGAFRDKSWRLAIEELDLDEGEHRLSARLSNPYRRAGCRRAVYLDVVYLERDPSEPSARPTSVSGEPMPRGDLPGWRQIFVDDFDRDVALGSFPQAVADKWGAYPYSWRDTKGQRTSDPEVGGWYHPGKTVSIADGKMDIWLHSERLDGADKRLVAAPQPRIHGANTSARKGQLYGRYAIRFRADLVKGYKTAWLLWPDSGVWPRDGEIDFPEGNLTGGISGYMHWQGATRGNQQYYALSGASFHDWHTAVIEWGPDKVSFYLDGELMTNASGNLSQWTTRVPDTPMHWVIQTETRLDAVQPTTADEGHVEIDWVAVWERR